LRMDLHMDLEKFGLWNSGTVAQDGSIKARVLAQGRAAAC